MKNIMNNSPTQCDPDKHLAWSPWLAALALIIVTSAVYAPLRHHDFVNFDDDGYVYLNKHVQSGLTMESIKWAFTLIKSDEFSYWHPLTWLSHMMDCQLFGLDAGKHHIVNLVIHIINVLLLYLVLHQMTGAVWKSAFVAALFALHPMNVDTVAWISERKNVLSTMCWLLTMLAYVHYARHPSWYRYLLVFTGMATGLLTKPMLVTLPCVLLLIDFWPLGRLPLAGKQTPLPAPFYSSSFARLITEKIPLLLLSVASILASVLSLKGYDRIVSSHVTPFSLRLGNAIISYPKYIVKVIWPHDMSVYYPFPGVIPLWQVLGALILLIAAFVTILFLSKKRPYLAVGWLWFFGTLIPVIGLVQGGLWPAMADRWTYVPAIGIFIIISWGGASLLQMLSKKKVVHAIVAVSILASLSVASNNQLRHWQNSITLFSHAVEVTENNDVAHYNLACELGDKGKTDLSITHYRAALKINPKYVSAYNNLGNALGAKGRIDDAIKQYDQALRIYPGAIEAHINLGKALGAKGMLDEAMANFHQAIQRDPDRAEIYIDMGKVLTKHKLFDRAMDAFHQALTIDPGLIEVHIDLGMALMEKGRLDEALAQFNLAIQRDPGSARAHNSLGNALAKKGLTGEAIDAFHQALNIDPGLAEVHNNLGNVLVIQRRLDEALYHYETIITEDRKDLITVKNRDALLSALQPSDQVHILFNTAVRFAGEKKYNRAIDLFKRILEINPGSPNIYYNISCLFALQNHKKEAIDWLQQAVDNGYDNWDKLKTDPDMHNIRETPYFLKLLKSEH